MAVATDNGDIGGGGNGFLILGGLADYATQPGVLLPGILGGLLTGQAYGRLVI